MPRPTIHCAPSVLKRKKFGAGLTSVVACAPEPPLMKVMLRLRLRVVLDRDALAARQRADHDVDLVLLDQLARGVDRDVGLGVGRGLDDLDLAPGDHAAALLDRQLGAAHAVGAAGRERPFERGQQADLHRLALLAQAAPVSAVDRRGAQAPSAPRFVLRHFHCCLLWL